MNSYTITALLAFAVSFLLAFFVLSRDRKNPMNILYFLFTFGVAVWCLCAAGLTVVSTKQMGIILDRAIYVLAPFIPSFYAHFIMVLINKVEKKKLILLLFYIESFIFTVLNFTDLFVLEWVPKEPYFNLMTVPNIGYIIFSLLFLIPPSYAFFTLFHVYKDETKSHIKNQYLYVLLASVVGFASPATYFLITYGIKSRFSPLANIFITISVIITAYAIVRHQLMEIEVIIKKTLVFAGLLAAVFAIVVLPTLIIQEYLFGKAGLGGRVLGLTISGVILIIAMRRIEVFLINITDRFLFQRKYDYKELLKTFTSEVLTILDLNKLVTMTVKKLTETVRLQHSCILLLDKQNEKYDLAACEGMNIKALSLPADNTLVTFLSNTKTFLSIKSVERKRAMPEKARSDMARMNFELAIPLITLHGEMIGILILGKKKSDEDYTQDDMDIMVPLARTLAIALSNALMFDELGKTQAEAAQKEKMAVIGTLSAGINHEICNPLGIARGQCEAFLLNMKDGLYKDKVPGELIDKALTIMGKVIHEVDRAADTTKRLTSFAKPSLGIISDDVDIKKELNEILALISYEMKMDKIDVVKEIDDNLPFISADRKALEEIFFNLIRNSSHAMKERGKITIRAKQKDGKILVEIEDTGEGIPEDKMVEIFNPFYTTKEPEKGTGLGLFIVRQVVERNRGRISVRSKVGEGTTIMLEFPIAKAKSKEKQSEKTQNRGD